MPVTVIAVTKSEGRGMGFPWEPLEGTNPVNTLTLEVYPPELRRDKFILF